jgi:hypothetical protein
VLSLYGEQLRQSQIIRNDLHRPETTAMEPSSVPLPQLVATVPRSTLRSQIGPATKTTSNTTGYQGGCSVLRYRPVVLGCSSAVMSRTHGFTDHIAGLPARTNVTRL